MAHIVLTKDQQVEELSQVVSVYSIFGVEPGSLVVTDHLKFINPRTSVNAEVVDSVSEQADIDDAILVYNYEGEDKFILLDGRNRLTGRLKFIRDNPDNAEGEFIEAKLFKGSYTEARAIQISRNLPDRKSALTDTEITLAIKRMVEDEGLSPEEVKAAFGWYGRMGAKRYNKYTALAGLEEGILDDYTKGDISTKVARAASKMPEAEAKVFVETAKALGNDDIVEQVTGVKLGNDVSKAKKSDILSELKQDLIYALVDSWMRNCSALEQMYDDYIDSEVKRCIVEKDQKGMFILLDDVKLLEQIKNYLLFLGYGGVETAEDAIRITYDSVFDEVTKSADRRLSRVLKIIDK
jgi:hypothetical protein